MDVDEIYEKETRTTTAMSSKINFFTSPSSFMLIIIIVMIFLLYMLLKAKQARQKDTSASFLYSFLLTESFFFEKNAFSPYFFGLFSFFPFLILLRHVVKPFTFFTVHNRYMFNEFLSNICRIPDCFSSLTLFLPLYYCANRILMRLSESKQKNV